LINNVLRVYLDIFIIVYLNNILIYSYNYKEYIKYRRTILTYLKNTRLLLNL
ncbi:hypothetical protein P154DRAFT_422309, partial [Amniculicola lignicola CBS 123094]